MNIETKYGTDVNLSRIYDIITGFKEVKNCSISFTPNTTTPASQLSTVENDYTLDANLYTPATSAVIVDRCREVLEGYLQYDINDDNDLDINIDEELTVTKPFGASPNYEDYVTFIKSIKRVKGLSEREFYDNFAKVLYNDPTLATQTQIDGVTLYIDTNDFSQFVSKVNSMMKESLRNSMMDEDGNIVNYSFPNEIVQLKSGLRFTY
jgi:hypothetical protein